ncbi:MAG TPA: hypothetical protein VGB55_01375 [Tepidisphaeraceae bacterium]|jgi:hypothetical protein
MASFREFLIEGKLGSVQLGMTPESVEREWGTAQDRSVKRRPVEILKFGAIELTFKQVPDTDDTRLVAASLYFYDERRRFPEHITFLDWLPNANTTETEFSSFLAKASLSVHSRVDGEYAHLVVDTGASATFVGGQLHSVHYRRVDKRPSRRQMSVSLPERTVEQLRARALREKISISELVEKVLSASH